MEKYTYAVLGFVLSIVSVGAVGLATGVPGACVYINSCEPDQEILRLQGEIISLNKKITEKSDELIQSANKIIELQNKARVSLEGAKLKGSVTNENHFYTQLSPIPLAL